MARAVKMKTFTGDIMASYGIISNPVNELDASSKNYISTNIQEAKSTYPQVKFLIVETLPEIGEELTLYFLKNKKDYAEFLWDSTHIKWELVGEPETDMTNYATKNWFNEQLNLYI